MNDARRHHDMGGLDAGPVDRDEHGKAPWEKRVDALLVLLGQRKIVCVDELRRGIEELGADRLRPLRLLRALDVVDDQPAAREEGHRRERARRAPWRRSRPVGGTSFRDCSEREFRPRRPGSG